MKNGVTDELEYFTARNNSLTCIETSDPTYATANWTSANGNIDAGVTFSVICGGTDLTTWHVATTGSDVSGSGTLASPLATIQTGVNAATEGDTVLVASGTYVENIIIDGKKISVIGEDRETTIIDGNNEGNVITITGIDESYNSIIKNFTIQNGIGESKYDGGWGGGIYIRSYPPTLDSLIIQNNTAGGNVGDGGGGGVCYVFSGETLNIKNSIIKDNNPGTSEFGGLFTSGGTIRAEKCLIFDNVSAVGGGNLGASHAELINCTITSNTHPIEGNFYSLSITNSIIYFNEFPKIEMPGDATVTYSNIEGGYTGTGNIDANPLFCDTLSYKYYATSPVIRAGKLGYNMGAGSIGCDVPPAFEWVSAASATINITESNLDDTYELQWTESKDVYGDPIQYLLYAQIGVLQPEEIYDITSTSVLITYEELLENVFEPFPMLPGATVKFSVVATDGIDTVKVTGDDRVLFVNRYEFLSTEGEGVPVEFALHENYPNPFNPTTTLRFDLPEVSNLTLTIYNMLGQRVRTFNMNDTPAGFHSIKWNATNDYGEPVGAGVYLYQLQANQYVKTRKMVLLK